MDRTALCRTLTAVGLAALLPSQLGVAASVDPIVEWSTTAAAAAATVNMPPLRRPITLALLHVAMYDAVSAVSGGRPYAISPPVARPASAQAAANEAAYRILLVELPGAAGMLTATYNRLGDEIVDSREEANGAAVGAAVAEQLLAMRRNDGRNAAPTYAPGSGAGVWVPTPPGLEAATTAFLGRVAPFTMESPSQFRPAGPPALGSPQWIRDYNEVKALGVKHRSARTAEQTATALFWEPLAGTVWPATVHRMARERRLDLAASARFHAATMTAFADALIACWDAKFHFNFWRPVTAIRAGDLDGSDKTDPDSQWEPLAVTPAFPEYPSGHACATAAVAHTIEDFFGEKIVIPAKNVVTGEERFYQRASDVIDEVIEARMLLGVHFRTADEDGGDMGRKIARQVRTRWLKP